MGEGEARVRAANAQHIELTSNASTSASAAAMRSGRAETFASVDSEATERYSEGDLTSYLAGAQMASSKI